MILAPVLVKSPLNCAHVKIADCNLSHETIFPWISGII